MVFFCQLWCGIIFKKYLFIPIMIVIVFGVIGSYFLGGSCEILWVNAQIYWNNCIVHSEVLHVYTVETFHKTAHLGF